MRDEIRPMLKQWLDANLPPLVERLVRTEIERVVGRAEPESAAKPRDRQCGFGTRPQSRVRHAEQDLHAARRRAALYEGWERAGAFAADPASDAAPFTIMIPPPNVTGSLHMGHALTFTVQDVLVRWRRMQGRDALWQPGTDHAGIATQMVVERLLAEQGITASALGREPFLERVWQWKTESAARSRANCAGWARRWTGRANGSPWTRDCPPQCGRCRHALPRGTDLPRPAPRELGPEIPVRRSRISRSETSR